MGILPYGSKSVTPFVAESGGIRRMTDAHAVKYDNKNAFHMITPLFIRQFRVQLPSFL